MSDSARAWLVAGLVATGAAAAPTTIHGDLIGGTAAFDEAVRAGGGQLALQPLHALREGVSSWTFLDFTIRTNNGRPHLVEPDYGQLRAAGVEGALSGAAIGLAVNDPAPLWGLSFEFDAPVNAFGLEVGDWATCCYESSLVIAFDGGAVRQVATASSGLDNPGFRRYGRFTNFVGAFDTEGSFTRVSFYGTGVGEYLVGGGTIRYALLDLPADVDADPPPGPDPRSVPEPAVWVLVAAALAAMDAALRRGRRGAQGLARRLRSARLEP